MAIIDPTPLNQPRDINYLAKLHETLRGIKKDFKTKIASSGANFESLEKVKTFDQSTLKESRDLGDQGLKDYETLRIINEGIVETDLQIQSVLTLSNLSASFAKETALKTAVAAKAIDAAHISVAKLTSHVASIQAKLNSEEKGSALAQLCAGAYESTQYAAIAAERLTVNILHATIEAAKSNSSSVANQIASAAQESSALTSSFSDDLVAAQVNAVDTYIFSLAELKNKYTNTASLLQAEKEHDVVKLMGEGAPFAFLYKEITVKHHKEISEEKKVETELKVTAQQKSVNTQNEKAAIATENLATAKEKAASSLVAL